MKCSNGDSDCKDDILKTVTFGKVMAGETKEGNQAFKGSILIKPLDKF